VPSSRRSRRTWRCAAAQQPLAYTSSAAAIASTRSSSSSSSSAAIGYTHIHSRLQRPAANQPLRPPPPEPAHPFTWLSR
jgi:hypothetical protein